MYEQRNKIGTAILTKKQKRHPSEGDYATTTKAAPGRVVRGEQGEARGGNSAPTGGSHREQTRNGSKHGLKKHFSTPHTTGQQYRTCIYTTLDGNLKAVRI